MTFSTYLELQTFRKSIHNGNTYAVKSGREFVDPIVEFASSVKSCHDYFGGRFTRLLFHINGNTSSVVDHGNAVIDMDRYSHSRTETGNRFVYCVVDNLVDQVM